MATVAIAHPARKRLLPEAWPLYALFVGFPVWWLFGLGAFIWPIVAVPMLLSLIIRREVRVPPAFALWALFLAWMLASGLMLDEPQRLLVFIYRASLYFSATILFLYVYNASPESLPASLVARILAVFGGFVVVGGFLGMVFASTSLSTPVEAAMSVIPGHLLSNEWLRGLVHVTFSQPSAFLANPLPRPSAPFLYANEWGANFTLLAPFLILAATRGVITRAHWLARFVLIASIVPLIVSVNRGAWIALAACLVYAAVRLAARGRSRALVSVLLVVIAFAGVILLTPLRGVVEDRIAHDNSSAGRLALYGESTAGVLDSPLFGFGSTRPSEERYQPDLGTQGQFWMVMFSHGIPAAILFVGWFLLAFWRGRQARSMVGIWSNVAVFGALLIIFYYGLLASQIHILMVALAVGLREVATLETTKGPGASEGISPAGSREGA